MTGQIFINAVGVAASICSMASFVPQVVKIVRERDASSVSARMYTVTIIGFALWVSYGVLLKSWPLIASNLINFILAGAILILKIRYRSRSSATSGTSPKGAV